MWNFENVGEGGSMKIEIIFGGPKQLALTIVLKKRKITWWNLDKIFEILKHFG